MSHFDDGMLQQHSGGGRWEVWKNLTSNSDSEQTKKRSDSKKILVPCFDYYYFLTSLDEMHVYGKQSQLFRACKKYLEIYLYKYSVQNKHIYTRLCSCKYQPKIPALSGVAKMQLLKLIMHSQKKKIFFVVFFLGVRQNFFHIIGWEVLYKGWSVPSEHFLN